MPTDELALRCHWMLLRLAGVVPDDLLSQARRWLAEGSRSDVARGIAHAVLAQGLPLIEEDLELLRELLAEAGADASNLSMVEIAEADQLGLHAFAPSRAQTDALLAGSEDPATLDPAAGTEPEDEIDRSVTGAMAAAPAAVGLWRAWRFAADGAPWPPPRRVYILEVEPDGDLVGLTDRAQRALLAAGETQPQVETYTVGDDLPVYQRMARAYGALIWSGTPDPGVRIARLFDSVDPQTGPSMAADHAIVDGSERDQMLAYLRSGEPLLVTTARMDDVVDRTREASVPMNFVTDGFWIWTDATTYYLEQHGLCPDEDLVSHIQARDFTFSTVDGAGVHRAMAVLQAPTTEEPAWTYG